MFPSSLLANGNFRFRMQPAAIHSMHGGRDGAQAARQAAFTGRKGEELGVSARRTDRAGGAWTMSRCGAISKTGYCRSARD